MSSAMSSATAHSAGAKFLRTGRAAYVFALGSAGLHYSLCTGSIE